MYPASFFCQQIVTKKKSQQPSARRSQILTKGHKYIYRTKTITKTKTITIRMKS